uniref:DUF5726 domain-containing protein n=1 Tax=Taenia asiatica TaxID=60517 RepID=A0A0R3VW89_TAEAS
LILRALPQELFLAAIDVGVTADSGINHCCKTLSQLAIDQHEQSLAREFFRWDQKAEEKDKESSTTNHRSKAPRYEDQRSQSFSRGCDQEAPGTSPDTGVPDGPPPAKPATSSLDSVASDPKSSKLEGYFCRFLLDSRAVKSSVNPKAFPNLHCKFCAGPFSIELPSAEGMKMKAVWETSLNVAVGKETWTVQFFLCPELEWDVILGADFFRKTKAIVNFVEGTFTAQQHKETSSVVSSSGKDADDICSALFEAADVYFLLFNPPAALPLKVEDNELEFKVLAELLLQDVLHPAFAIVSHVVSHALLAFDRKRKTLLLNLSMCIYPKGFKSKSVTDGPDIGVCGRTPVGDVFEGEEEYHVEVNAIGSVIGHEPATCEPKVRMRSLFTTSGLPLTHHSPCRTTATAILPIHHPTCHFTFYQPFQCICSKNACTVCWKAKANMSRWIEELLDISGSSFLDSTPRQLNIHCLPTSGGSIPQDAGMISQNNYVRMTISLKLVDADYVEKAYGQPTQLHSQVASTSTLLVTVWEVTESRVYHKDNCLSKAAPKDRHNNQ